jgi:hypothetical protein
LSRVCFGKVKSEARPDQLITFARCLREALPIQYRDLPAAARNQTGTFQLPGSIRDGRPLDTQHFGEKALSDRQRVLVTVVTHHQQPTCQPLLEAAAEAGCRRGGRMIWRLGKVAGRKRSQTGSSRPYPMDPGIAADLRTRGIQKAALPHGRGVEVTSASRQL